MVFCIIVYISGDDDFRFTIGHWKGFPIIGIYLLTGPFKPQVTSLALGFICEGQGWHMHRWYGVIR